MLASVGLVHLNGRVYDPYIGRMTSADPVVGDPLNGQSWNRYSYVDNNPLTFTDPSGYCADNCIGTINPQPPKPSGLMQLVETAFQLTAAAICIAGEGACTPFMPVISSAISAYFAGVTTGSLKAALKAGVITYATTMAFNEVGDITTHKPPFGSSQFFANVAGHALVGCGQAAASGGKCGPGALSAAVSAFAGPLVARFDRISGLMVSAGLGGLASVAGGGKFANGAVTAAFGYLFNQLAEKDPVEAKLKGYAARAVAEFDAMGDTGFTEAQLAAIKDKPYLREMYRGYNVDLLVRDMVLGDPELSGRLVGAPNKGVDFTDTKTGIRYEMTTPGQFQVHQRAYGSGIRFIDISRRPLVDVGPGGVGAGPNLPPSFRGGVVEE